MRDVLTRETLTTMQTAATPAGSGAGAVGPTWLVKEVGGLKTVRHTDGTNGQLSVLQLAPPRRFALTIVTNADRGGELHSAILPGALCRFCGIGSAPTAPLRQSPRPARTLGHLADARSRDSDRARQGEGKG